MQDDVAIVTAWLSGIPARPPEVTITAGTELIEQGLLDSIEILNLVSFLEERFNVALPIDDFIPSNFRNATAIGELIARLRGQAAMEQDA